ncbi:unnamed protein product [Owenia fusiformis]|uniref:Uncharacterized protein n=1 Tax=Owenia fusiformis TaxID=6347 RepID=A0A8J1TVW4_OWEFU|nr:unnamed protein product [Owenia fusiformis]
MRLTWQWLCVFPLVISGMIHSVIGLQCYQCTEIPTNDLCNDEGTITCTDPTHNACYKRKHQMEAFGVRYTKSCINMEKCAALQRLNNEKVCKRTPSNCIYCCQDKDLCNSAYILYSTWRNLVLSFGVFVVRTAVGI